MLRCLLSAIALLVALSLAQGTPSAPVHKKRNVTRHWHGYGFLPGYRPPEVIERERAAENASAKKLSLQFSTDVPEPQAAPDAGGGKDFGKTPAPRSAGGGA